MLPALGSHFHVLLRLRRIVMGLENVTLARGKLGERLIRVVVRLRRGIVDGVTLHFGNFWAS